MEKLRFDITDYSVVVKKEQGLSSEPVEVGDLSSWYIEPDRAIAGFFPHCGGG